MRSQVLGQSNLSVSVLAYGLWRFTEGDLKAAHSKIDAALSVGINFIDQADVYGVDGGGAFGDSELLLGRVFKERPDLRDQLVIASKGGIVLGVPYDSSPAYLRSAVEASLTRMGIECIDLYQIHRPDFLGHPEHIAEVLTQLRAEGKIREVGVSNYSPSQFRALQRHLSFPIATRQPQFSCWHHQPLRDGTLDQCLEYKTTPLAWSPMAGGRLGLDPKEALEQGGRRLVELIGVLDRIAGEKSVSRGAIALAWILRHPSKPIAIIGTQKTHRIVESAAASDVYLSRSEWNEILVAAQGEPLP